MGKLKDEIIELPDGVTGSMTDDTLTVKGEKGEVSRKFAVKNINVTIDAGKISIIAFKKSRTEKTIVGSFKAHVNNMIKGVQESHIYKMKVFSGHFPMTATVTGNKFEVKNFIGEKTPRVITFPENVKVTVKGADIAVESCDIEAAGIAISKIEQSMKRTLFDRRIFQDGIIAIK